MRGRRAVRRLAYLGLLALVGLPREEEPTAVKGRYERSKPLAVEGEASAELLEV